MTELTPSRRSALLARLLADMEKKNAHTGTKTGAEAGLRILGKVLQKKRIDKLTQEEAEGQESVTAALSKSVPGTDRQELEAILGDPEKPLEVTNVRRKGDQEAALAEVLKLPGALRAQGLEALAQVNQVREPGKREQFEMGAAEAREVASTRHERDLEKQATKHEQASILQEKGWDRRDAQFEVNRRHDLAKTNSDQRWKSQEKFLDREFQHQQDDEDRSFKLEVEAAKNQFSSEQGLDLTQDQANAMIYGVRNDNATMVLDAYGSEFTGLEERAAKNMMNGWKPGKRQQFEQATRNFINATLRRESGAVISDDEFDNAEKQYIPQPGDKKAVLEQKRINRQTVVKGLALSSGGGYEKLREQSERPELIEPESTEDFFRDKQ